MTQYTDDGFGGGGGGQQQYMFAGPSQQPHSQPPFEHLATPIQSFHPSQHQFALHIPPHQPFQNGYHDIPQYVPPHLQSQPIAGPSYLPYQTMMHPHPHPHLPNGYEPQEGIQMNYQFGGEPVGYGQEENWMGQEWDDGSGEGEQNDMYGMEVSPGSSRKSDRQVSVPPPSRPRRNVGRPPMLPRYNSHQTPILPPLRSQNQSKPRKRGCAEFKADGLDQVKHRKRTTPEQLKVLERWFDENPKPDNNTREFLASTLGMTKRNVQVWFQNR